MCLYKVRQMENNNNGSVGFLSSFYTARQDCKISAGRFCNQTAVAGGVNCNVADDSHNLYSQCKTFTGFPCRLWARVTVSALSLWETNIPLNIAALLTGINDRDRAWA